MLQGSGGCEGCSQSASSPAAPLSLGLLLLAGLLGLRRRRELARGSAGLLLGLALLLPTAANAFDTPKIDAQRFDPALQVGEFVRVRDAELGDAGRWGIALSLNYARNPLELGSFEGLDRRIGVVDHLVGFDLWAAWTPIRRLRIGLGLPVLQLQPSSPETQAVVAALGGSGKRVGIGDLRVGIAGQILLQEDQGVNLSGELQLVIPTGSRAQFIGAGSAGLDINFALGRRWKHFLFDVNLGARGFIGGQPLLGLQPDDELRWAVGLGVPIGDGTWTVQAEWMGATVIDPVALDQLGLDPFDARHTPMEISIGARFDPEAPIAVAFGIGPGLTKGFGSPDIRVWAALTVAPEGVGDRDGDGLSDRVDACPAEPEDVDMFEDGDGCPDRDNDDDGVLDVDDGAPLVPEDRDGWEDGDGVPDPDNDGDGLTDDRDGCPIQPEDPDGWEDEDGCPDPYNDSDGILDVDDDCPLQPEIINAVDDEDGCPDEGLVQIGDEGGVTKIFILEKVYFDTSKATIKRRSYAVLDAVRDVMIAYPGIARVEIQGHTDSDGNDAANQGLSERRAGAVMRYLMEAGIDPDRLVAVGYGESRPIDTNRTSEGKANNRRVEFVVVAQDGD